MLTEMTDIDGVRLYLSAIQALCDKNIMPYAGGRWNNNALVLRQLRNYWLYNRSFIVIEVFGTRTRPLRQSLAKRV